jgi:hypothetical protein
MELARNAKGENLELFSSALRQVAYCLRAAVVTFVFRLVNSFCEWKWLN